MKLKNRSAWITEKRMVNNNSLPFPLKNFSGCLPNIMRKEDLITVKSLVVKKKRNRTPKGPESLFDMEITFNSLMTFFTMIVLYG